MTMPTQGADQPNRFDRFADWADRWSSKSIFFAFCVGLVVGWLPTWFLVRNLDTWQLLINSPTTIITFLLVSLAANVGRRSGAAAAQKQNAIAAGLATLLDERDRDAAGELREAVGLEENESSD